MLNEIDYKLLSLIQRDCKLSYAELGEEVGLSVSAVNERLKKLAAGGYIREYEARLDAEALGFGLCAFIQVQISGPQSEGPFLKRMARLAPVQECHHITGEYSYLLKIRVRNTADLERLLKEELKTIPGLVRTQTTIVLSTPKETAALPLDEKQLKGEEDD